MFWSGGPSPPSPPPPGRIKGKKFALQDALAVGLQIVVHGTPVALLFAGTRCFVCCTTPSALEPVPFSVDLLVAYCRHRLISFPKMVSIFLHLSGGAFIYRIQVPLLWIHHGYLIAHLFVKIFHFHRNSVKFFIGHRTFSSIVVF